MSVQDETIVAQRRIAPSRGVMMLAYRQKRLSTRASGTTARTMAGDA
jgi:hypothetical protein